MSIGCYTVEASDFTLWNLDQFGGVPEWTKGPVLKTGDGVTRPWVRIPPPPLNDLCPISLIRLGIIGFALNSLFLFIFLMYSHLG